VFYHIGVGLSVGLLALVILLGMVAIGVPAIAGATPMTVLTSSMEPKLPPGTLVIIKPIKTPAIRIGDIITYQLKSNEPGVVTHRVTAISHASDGTLGFTTKGDNNDVADDAEVKPVQVVGKLWYSIPWIGYVNNLVGQHRAWLVPVVAVALFLYAGFMVASGVTSFVKKRRARSMVSEQPEQASITLGQHPGTPDSD
jgi:signal peptidase I